MCMCLSEPTCPSYWNLGRSSTTAGLAHIMLPVLGWVIYGPLTGNSGTVRVWSHISRSIAEQWTLVAMFHQEKVAEEDRLSLLSLVATLWSTSVWHSFISQLCKLCTDDNRSEFAVEAIPSFKQNFYMNDCLKSSATEETAISWRFLLEKGRHVVWQASFQTIVINCQAALISL